MRVVTIGAAALALVVAAGLGALQAADPAPVMLAVLRGDGVLIPFATRSGTRWQHSWPKPIMKPDVPLTFDEIPRRWWGKVPPTRTWQAWQIDGRSSEVTVERPVWYLAQCLQGVGLKTSLTAQPPLPPPTRQPYPKLGLAATAPLAFQRIESLRPSEAIWPQVGAALNEAVTLAEARMDGQPRTVFAPKHPMPAAERDKVAVRVEALYRMPVARDRFLYYVESTKTYGMPPISAATKDRFPTPGPDGCSFRTFAAGWFVAGAQGGMPETLPLEDVKLTSCDYDGIWLMLPLAYVADSGRYWIAQLASRDRESYAVLRWDAEKGVPVTAWVTPAGGCDDTDGW
jgi:hypothetical protein